jgi:hypothetical protein
MILRGDCGEEGGGEHSITGTYMMKAPEGAIDNGNSIHFLKPTTNNSVNERS